MTNKKLFVHSALAIVALVVAFIAWRHDRQGTDESVEDASDEVVVADIARANLKSVVYQSESRTVEVELAKETAGPHFVTVTTKMKVRRRPESLQKRTESGNVTDAGPAGDSSPGGDTGPSTSLGDADPTIASSDTGRSSDAGSEEAPAEPEYEIKQTRFAANEELDTLLDKLTPLKAVRRLGALGPDQLEEFELDDPPAKLELKLADGTRRFKIGGRTFGAGSHYYVLDERTGEAHLLSATIIRGLELAQTKLMQRELHRFDLSEAAQAVVTFGDKTIELNHKNQHSKGGGIWVKGTAEESTSQATTQWMRKLNQLRVVTYLESEENFDPSKVMKVFQVEYSDDAGGKLGQVEFGELVGTNQYVAQSEATGGWVGLSFAIARELSQELETIIDGE